MPRTKVVLYREDNGGVPLLDWLDHIPSKAVAKCRVRIERLGECGHELRRPEADYLRDDIYELRVSFQGIHYRVLYFFHDDVAVVLTHGLIKEREVPTREIDKAIERRQQYKANPLKHTHQEP